MSDAHRALVAERVQMQRRAVGKKKAPVVSAPDSSPVLVPRQRTTTTTSSSSDQQSSTSPTPLRKQSSSSVNSGSTSAKPKFDERNYVPCRYFASGGNCRDGDKCPFSHSTDLIGIFSGGTIPQDVFSPSQRPVPQPKRSSSKKPTGAKKKRSPSQTRQQVGDAMNVDGMSYEQLTDLCDRMGKVKVGVDKSILDTLPCITVKTITTEKCAICLEVFNIGDEMKILPCSHPFHPDCINEWLDGSKKCPNCNEEITTTTPSNISKTTAESETEKDSRDRGVNHSVLSSSQYDTPPPAVRPGLAPASNTSIGGATNVVRWLPISNTTSTPVALPPLANRYSPERTAVARTSPPPMVPTSSAGSSTTTAGGRTPLVFSSAAAVLASLADDP